MSTPQLVVGFIGLGRMGSPMAANIRSAGFELHLFNRTRSKAEEEARRTGSVVGDSPAAVASSVDVVVTMLADHAAIDEMYLQPGGILEGLRPNAIAVDMSTLGPDAVLDLADKVRATGAEFVDAPVSGSVALAESAALTIMVGGEPDVVERARPVLETMGARVFHVGPVGTGATMKLAVNTVVYGLCQALSEGLVLAERAGIQRGIAYDVFSSSAISAPFVHYRRREFEHPGQPPVSFRLALAKKDMDLIMSLGERLGSPLPQARVNTEVLEAARTSGLADADVSAVADFLRQLAEERNA
jgi:3-hydroxyisobutyrate dehydrogenase-like beta-hydroxyacid dehydrogenase